MNILEVVNILVCRNELFSFLEVDDLLQLRRVSKTFRNEADDFIRMKKKTTRRMLEIHLCEDDPFKELRDFRNRLSNLPIRTRAYITFAKQRGRGRMLDTLRRHFFFTYGSSITHLYLNGLTLPLYSEIKFRFFDPLPNVTHLLIETVYPPPRNEIPSSANDQEIKIPASFHKLKSLIVLEVATCRSISEKQLAFRFVSKLVETCLPTLENLELPYQQMVSAGVNMQQVMHLLCKCLFTCPKLKLSLVSGRVIEDLLKLDQRTPEMRTLVAMITSINEKIVSIKDPRSKTFRLELPNLELIRFVHLYACNMPAAGYFVRRDWPKLKEIEINLKDIPEGSLAPYPKDVWDFFFGHGIRRENVVRLEIGFDGFQIKNITAARRQNLLNTLDLTTSCPNLKIIRLKHEIKQLVSLHLLWNWLPLLEDVHFENSKDLADSDFIGNNPQNPVFWKLKNLKVLKLEEINDLMLTNDLLSKVLYNMPLQHFTLSSDRSHPDLHSIDLKGIRSLLNGRFGNTIQVLHVGQLCQGHVSYEKKMKLERRFGSMV